MKFDSNFFKVTLKAWEAAGEKGIDAIILVEKGLRGDRTGTYKELIDELSLVIDNAGEIFVKEASDHKGGIKKFLQSEMAAKADNVQFKQTGAIHHIHAVAELIKKKAGKLKHIEYPQDIELTINNVLKGFGRRDYDAVVQVGNKEIYIDAKSWLPSETPTRLKASLKGSHIEGEKSGQLLKDLINIHKNIDESAFKIEWHFDRRTTAKDAENYLKVIKDELLDDDGGGKVLRSKLGLEGKDNIDNWKESRRAIITKLESGFIQVTE